MTFTHRSWFTLLVFGLVLGAGGVLFETQLSGLAWTWIRVGAVFIVCLAVTGHVHHEGEHPSEISWRGDSKKEALLTFEASPAARPVDSSTVLADKGNQSPGTLSQWEMEANYMNGRFYPQALD